MRLLLVMILCVATPVFALPPGHPLSGWTPPTYEVYECDKAAAIKHRFDSDRNRWIATFSNYGVTPALRLKLASEYKQILQILDVIAADIEKNC
jgi:hypothetical protein